MIVDLKPYSAMKDSGVEWLGDVPEHWKVLKIKHWLHTNLAVLPETTSSDYKFNYLDIGAVGTGRLTTSPVRIRFSSAPSRARRIVRTGDTILSTVRTYLKAVWHVAEPVEDLVASTGFAVLSPKPGTSPKFVSYVVQSEVFTSRVTAESTGIAYPAIAETKLGNLEISVPPLPEQAAIVRFLDHMDKRVQRCIRAKKKLIELLEEQKKAIIHQAVTRGLNPDATMKDSGVEWLGDVPEHWEVLKIKHWLNTNLAVLPETTSPDYKFNYLDIGAVGTGQLTASPVQISFSSAPSRARRVVRIGDTILSTVRTYLKAVWHVEETVENLVASTGFAVFSPRPGTSPKFVSYVVQSEVFTNRVTAESTGIAYPAIGETKLGILEVCVPPLSEQAAIVQHLDLSTANISTAMDRARREIKLLGEYRTRLIADVVTGKLDVREAAAKLPDESDDAEMVEELHVMDGDESAGYFVPEEIVKT